MKAYSFSGQEPGKEKHPGWVSGLEDSSGESGGRKAERRPPKQMRKALEVGPRGRKQSPKYRSQRCRPNKESQTRTRPSKSVQRVWHRFRHRRGDNHRAWARRNSFSFPFSLYPLAPGWSFGAVSGIRQNPQEGVTPFTKGGNLPLSALLTPVQLPWLSVP